MIEMQFMFEKYILKKKLNLDIDVHVSTLNILHRSNCCAGYMLEINKIMCVGKYH